MSGDSYPCEQSELEFLLLDPRPGDETETVEKGGGGGETKRLLSAALFDPDPRDGDETEKTPAGPVGGARAGDPREGDETETTERGAGEGSKRRIAVRLEGPRDGDETVPLEESPVSPPVQV